MIRVVSKKIAGFLLSRVKGLCKMVRKSASVVVNYTIFYFRVFVLREDRVAARREHHEEYVAAQKKKEFEEQTLKIAIANQNKSKYSETFVTRHREQLPFINHYLYGGTLPTIAEGKGDLIADNKDKIRFLQWWEQFRELGEGYYLRKNLKSYLLDNNISVVLAEFGQTGASLTPVCREAGIPLVVIFHGYDANHQGQVTHWQERYQELFGYACKIVGVSREICQKLINMGAPKDKVVHLPCGIDLDKFHYKDHSQSAPVFLSVGRFEATKGQEITILAFHRLLEKAPEAKLVMVGNGKEHGLLESAMMLAKALELEDKIEFRGVLSHEQISEEMANARALVQHSVTTPIHHDQEGTPLVVMEAMASGLPVITTKHAGIKDVVTHEKTGLLVDEYDYRQMAVEMEKVVRDDQLVAELGKEAAESIRQNELINDNISKLAAIIENCANGEKQ